MALKRMYPLGRLLLVALCVALMLCIQYDTGKAGAQMDREAKMEVLRLAGKTVGEDFEAYLTSSDQALLDAAAYMWSYLQGKYPSDTFTLTGCAPYSMLQGYDLFELKSSGQPEGPFEVAVYSNKEDQSLYAQDNYYTMRILPAFQGAVSREVTAFFSTNHVDAKMDQFLGEAYGETLSLEQAMAMDTALQATTRIFVSGVGLEEADFIETCQRLEKRLTEQGFTGIYLVYALQEELTPGQAIQAEKPVYRYFYRWQNYR